MAAMVAPSQIKEPRGGTHRISMAKYWGTQATLQAMQFSDLPSSTEAKQTLL